MIPNNELLEDIQRVADIVDGNPSTADYIEHGKHSTTTMRERFGSWIDAKREAGVGGRTGLVPKDAIIEDIRRVADELGETPTYRQYHEHGRHSETTARTKFGSWLNAVEEAGLPRRRGRGIQRDPPPASVLYRQYYEELMTMGDIAEAHDTTRHTVRAWFNDAGFVLLPKSVRYLMSNGPSADGDISLRHPGVHRFKLRSTVHTHSGKQTTGSVDAYPATIFYLPTHEPEDIVRAVIEEAYDTLQEHDRATRSYLFGTHGRQFREAFEALRHEYDL